MRCWKHALTRDSRIRTRSRGESAGRVTGLAEIPASLHPITATSVGCLIAVRQSAAESPLPQP